MRVRRTEKDYKCFGRVLGSMLGWGGERTRVHTWWTVMLVGSKWKYRVDGVTLNELLDHSSSFPGQ